MKFGMNLLLWTGAMNDDMIPVVASLKEMATASKFQCSKIISISTLNGSSP